MTSSLDAFRPDAVLAQVFALLDAGQRQRAIDEPIERAATSFPWEPDPPASHRQFHLAIARLIRHLYRCARQPPQNLSPDEAGAEAVALLEAHYPGAPSGGYDTALRDALDPGHDGIHLVLAHLTAIVRDDARRRYTNWVVADALGRLSWTERCQVAARLLERLHPFAPPPLQRCVAAELVDEISALITLELNSDALLHHLPDITASFRGR